MTRTLTLSSAGGSVTIDGHGRVRIGIKVRGTGMPPVHTQWFEGVGDGAQYRGGRTLSRVLDLPIKIYARSRAEVNDVLGELSRIFTLANAPVTVKLDLDGEVWELQCVRTGGGDWDWDSDTDGKTFLRTIVTVQGDPFWKRSAPESRVITPAGVGYGLLGAGQSLSELIVSDTEGTGVVTLVNTGDVETPPTWTVYGPYEGFELTLGDLSLAWTGLVAAGEFVRVDVANGTVTDETGANVYAALGPAPKFWRVPPGTSEATISLNNPTGAARIEVYWSPLKLAVF